MSEKKQKGEKQTVAASLTKFLEKNRKLMWTVLIVVVVAFAAYAVFSVISEKSTAKTLALVDQISYELTNGSYSLEDSEIAERRNTAKEALAPLTEKSGVGGVRANMLMAELVYQENNFSEAVECWKKAAAKGKKSYTAPLAYFNIASCSEELGNTEEAETYYKKAADSEGFLLKSHALFSYGRVLELNGKTSEACEVYTSLYDSMPDDTWAKLAKTRLIDLKISGKIE